MLVFFAVLGCENSTPPCRLTAHAWVRTSDRWVWSTNASLLGLRSYMLNQWAVLLSSASATLSLLRTRACEGYHMKCDSSCMCNRTPQDSIQLGQFQTTFSGVQCAWLDSFCSPLSCDFKNEVLSCERTQGWRLINSLGQEEGSACCTLINSYAFSLLSLTQRR